jgi:DNA-binding CsgD family transcriptional regulator
MVYGVQSRLVQTTERTTRTIACIDVRNSDDEPDGPRLTRTAAAMACALVQIERTLRAGDRICPMSACQMAVEFAPAASGVPAQVLGDRLARAIGTSMGLDRPRSGLTVSVGVAAPEPRLGSVGLTARAMAAARAGGRQLRRAPFAGTRGCDTLVTVDQVVAPRPASSALGPIFEGLHRRRTFRYEGGRICHTPSLHPVPISPAAAVRIHLDESGPTVLIADPRVTDNGGPGLAAATAAALAEQLGCRTAVVTASVDDPPALAVDGVALDLVVLVLDGGWIGRSPTSSSCAWATLAQLTSSWVAAGVPVLAVGAGAPAGAVASCVAHGARVVPHLDDLPDGLRALRTVDDPEVVGAWRPQLSAQFLSLVALTASERRVLFYLTEGWAAQDIATHLVVSLTTVRSHIRSVLRKIGVRSQLAAVAVANSRDLGHPVADRRS